MDEKAIIKTIYDVNPDKNDLIVLNGGEPTIHPNFYSLLSELTSITPAKIAVYSNGISLTASRIPQNSNISFIIPIHGRETSHDRITQVRGSFCKTINNLHSLASGNHKYRIKFIINEYMIESNFNFRNFIMEYDLNPEEIIIARLNETIKSKRNNVCLPSNERLKTYLNKQIFDTKDFWKLKILDIPPCYINAYSHIENSDSVIPKFFFNDPDNTMRPTAYYKAVMIGANCDNCPFNSVCKIMKNTYLTLSLTQNNFCLEME